ncbi:hypothetical protein M8818_002419 [Zalaria obscura]|uniref:Uncharacterized protein n=1 Tax=Zalaria obscura TaxID=2024903 RepID=A0ACC3SJN7_9PEZI
MSGTEQTFHYTKEDVRKLESRESNLHNGQVPADSNAAAMQSVVDAADKNKSEIINERQANLPLPEQPPVASDWNSSDASTVNVGSGGQSDQFSVGNASLREPATGDSGVRSADSNLAQGAGREGKDNLGGLPNDAVAREAKGKAGTTDTTNKDYGYPQKNDPSSGL